MTYADDRMSGRLGMPCFVGDPGPGFIRPLGAGEHFFNLYAQVWPVHFCMCAEIDGWIRPELLRRALDEVRERHPVLGARIVNAAVFGAALYRSCIPLPFEIAAVGKDAGWRRAVESELRKPMPVEEDAMLRLTAVYAPDRTAIILTFHHAVADGMSGAAVLGDLLRALAGERLEALPFPLCIEEKILGPSVFNAPTPWPNEITGVPQQPAKDLEPSVLTAAFTREETSRLRDRCRTNGTTIQGAICAAAARHLPLSERGAAGIICPISLRRAAGIEDGACGVFIGAASLDLAVNQFGPIWSDAARAMRMISQARSPEAVRDFISGITAGFPPTAGTKTLRAFFAATPPSALVISNLGVLPIAERYGPFAVNAVWGPVMLTNLPADRQTLGVSTFAGRLRLVQQSYRPIVGLLPAIRETLWAALD